MKHRRAVIGGAIVAAWIIGLAIFVRREYYRPQVERLAEAAMRVTPGVVFYGVMQGDRQVGFASSTIDTAQTSLTVDDYLVADVPMGGRSHRATARSTVTLSRGLRVKHFALTLRGDGAPITADGMVEGDSVLVLAIASDAASPDTQRVALTGPFLLPTLIPIALALGESPAVGKHYVLPVFDPASMAPKAMGLDIRAESVFVVDDSAVVDSETGKWRGVLPDSLHAWRVTTSTGGGFSAWIDDQGRIVETTLLGFTLERLPYELAFENWRNDSSRAVVAEDRDIIETTAIAANQRLTGDVDALRVRLTNVQLNGFDLAGSPQQLSGDTLAVTRSTGSALVPHYQLPALGSWLDTTKARQDPLIQSRAQPIRALAQRLRRSERDPAVVARRINEWVHDSISDRVTFGIPSALDVLKRRSGDCNEHTQLFVALARSIGIPARVAAGLAYVNGKFYYHAWPEIMLGDWVPVDPTFGQFPADAAHLRFVVGGLTRQTELLQLVGALQIEVLSVAGPDEISRGAVPRP